jgi:hypothetical protein
MANKNGKKTTKTINKNKNIIGEKTQNQDILIILKSFNIINIITIQIKLIFTLRFLLITSYYLTNQ